VNRASHADPVRGRVLRMFGLPLRVVKLRTCPLCACLYAAAATEQHMAVHRAR
jgi:hypothetical protein